MYDADFDNGPYTDRFNVSLACRSTHRVLTLLLRNTFCSQSVLAFGMHSTEWLSLSIYIYNLLGPMGNDIWTPSNL